MKFDYKDIPAKTKSVKPLIVDKIVGEAKDINVESETVFEEMHELGWKMVKTCIDYDGVGLAAPQIGIRKKAFLLIDLENPEVWKFDGTMSLYINPTYKVAKDAERVMTTEGCLSVPNKKRYEIKRPNKILASYWYFDKRKKIKFYKDEPLNGYMARMFLHEYDHLKGENIVELWKKQNTKIKRGRKKKN